uniref:Uncharacterized protein n=1 Tax=Coturnix japonica TaxID=93934 RepID=A0A8C2T335_COTJA
MRAVPSYSGVRYAERASALRPHGTPSLRRGLAPRGTRSER